MKKKGTPEGWSLLLIRFRKRQRSALKRKMRELGCDSEAAVVRLAVETFCK